MDSIQDLEETVARYQVYVDKIEASGNMQHYYEEHRRLETMKIVLEERRHAADLEHWSFREGCFCQLCRQSPQYKEYQEMLESMHRAGKSNYLPQFLKALIDAGLEITVVAIHEREAQ